MPLLVVETLEEEVEVTYIFPGEGISATLGHKKIKIKTWK